MPRTNAPMNISVTFRHTEPTEALKKYVTEKLGQCLSRYISHHTDVQAVLSVSKRDHIVDVRLHSKGYEASAKAVTTDLYSAIDKVIDSLNAQLRKQKGRVTDRKPDPRASVEGL